MKAIDLPGTRLIGAFIATLGLPQVKSQTESVVGVQSIRLADDLSKPRKASFPIFGKSVAGERRRAR